MLIAGLVAFVFLVMWSSNRRGLHLVLAGVFALICCSLYFVERAIVTEGERLQQRVRLLCEDFRKKDARTLNYFSKSRPDLMVLVQTAMAMVTIQSDFRLSDFQTTLTNENSRATVHFRANATIGVQGIGDVGYQPARLILAFQKEGGEWKIVDIERLNPINGKKMSPLDQSPG